MDDLTLPVSRCPGIADVAREVLGFDVWALTLHADCPWWVDAAPVVPPHVPAGRLVAETWLWMQDGTDFDAADDDTLHAACLYLGDLLRVCSALGVEVPAGTVPPFALHFALAGIWRLGDCDDPRLGWAHTFGIEIESWADGRHHVVPGLVSVTSPREALDAILAEVVDASR